MAREGSGLARTLHEAPSATADALRLAGVLGISDACGVSTVRLSVSDPVVPTRRAPLQSHYGLHEVSGPRVGERCSDRAGWSQPTNSWNITMRPNVMVTHNPTDEASSSS